MRKSNNFQNQECNLKKELKDTKDQISNGLSLKGGKEIWESIFQFYNNGDFGEFLKVNEEKEKGVKNSIEDKENEYEQQCKIFQWMLLCV